MVYANTEPIKVAIVANIAMQSLDLMTENLIKESIRISDYVIEIDLRDVKPFSISKLEFCYKEGYMQTLDNIAKLKKELRASGWDS